MKQAQKIRYREWEIIAFAVPTDDGKWSANCEIDKTDVQGSESFQGALETFARDSKDAAIKAACEDAKRRIDDITANPLG